MDTLKDANEVIEGCVALAVQLEQFATEYKIAIALPDRSASAYYDGKADAFEQAAKWLREVVEA